MENKKMEKDKIFLYNEDNNMELNPKSFASTLYSNSDQVTNFFYNTIGEAWCENKLSKSELTKLKEQTKGIEGIVKLNKIVIIQCAKDSNPFSIIFHCKLPNILHNNEIKYFDNMFRANSNNFYASNIIVNNDTKFIENMKKEWQDFLAETLGYDCKKPLQPKLNILTLRH